MVCSTPRRISRCHRGNLIPPRAVHAGTARPRMERDMRMYLVDLLGDLHDLRGRKSDYPPACRDDDYAAGQDLARTLQRNGADGIVYRSVRRKDGECAAVFRPASVERPAGTSPLLRVGRRVQCNGLRDEGVGIATTRCILRIESQRLNHSSFLQNCNAMYEGRMSSDAPIPTSTTCMFVGAFIMADGSSLYCCPYQSRSVVLKRICLSSAGYPCDLASLSGPRSRFPSCFVVNPMCVWPGSITR